MPAKLGPILGDIIHNIRTALDLAICDAVRAHSGANSIQREHSFPIFNRRREFTRQASKKINGVNPRTRRLIERLKPYKGGCDSLWIVHNLDILDKHNAIIPVGAAYRHFTIKPIAPRAAEPIQFPGVNIKPADRLYPLEDGTTIFGVRAAARDQKNEADFEFAFEVAFGEGEIVKGEPLFPTIGQLGRLCERIVLLIERCNS